MTDFETSRPIGFIDSGIGGLPYLQGCRDLLPHERLVYLGDSANFPYGSRNRKEIESLVNAAVARLVDVADPKLVVVACNTASVVSLAMLRDRFSLPFVGVVPAIKPAAELRPGGKIAVLSTERTAEDPYLDDLERRFASASEVVRIPVPGLVQAIEYGGGEDSPETRERVGGALKALRNEGPDVVVLGCTHFVHVREMLQQSLGGTPVLDSVNGVARQIVRVNPGQGFGTGALPDLLFATGAPNIAYERAAARFDLELHWCDHE